MRRGTLIFIICVTAILIVVCVGIWKDSPVEEDQGKTLDKDGSVETAISVQHADSIHDIILTSHKVWIRNKEYTTLIHRDTIPSLDSLTTTAENGDGNALDVRLKKDYQLFITVK